MPDNALCVLSRGGGRAAGAPKYIFLLYKEVIWKSLLTTSKVR